LFTGNKLDEINAMLGHSPQKSLRHLAQETRVSKPSAQNATVLLKLKLS
jgi:hypothetical protein